MHLFRQVLPQVIALQHPGMIKCTVGLKLPGGCGLLNELFLELITQFRHHSLFISTMSNEMLSRAGGCT